MWLIPVSRLTWILLVANSTPIVDFDSKLNSLRVNLESRLLLPTPESPISTTETYHGDQVTKNNNMSTTVPITAMIRNFKSEIDTPLAVNKNGKR